jgi:outer membrane protein OmpA-like peptidoglycan-associated protein
MINYSRELRRLSHLIPLLMIIWIAPVHAENTDRSVWFHKGWAQHHPHIGNNILSSAGTQYYFAPADHVQISSDGGGMVDVEATSPDTPPDVDVGINGKDANQSSVSRSGTTPQSPPDPDLDGDGIHVASDDCPNTPIGAKVGPDGCWNVTDILFDFDKSEIKPSFKTSLDEVGYVLRRNQKVTLQLSGHADSTGSDAYNQKLSERRAMSVRDYLEGRGLSRIRFNIEALGESQPVATNSTSEGRAKNRRVELTPSRR